MCEACASCVVLFPLLIIGRLLLLLPFYRSQNYRFIDVDKFDHSSTGSRFVLSRLRKHCQYEIVIQAINTYGEGPLSRSSIGRTMEDGKEGLTYRPTVTRFVHALTYAAEKKRDFFNQCQKHKKISSRYIYKPVGWF